MSATNRRRFVAKLIIAGAASFVGTHLFFWRHGRDDSDGDSDGRSPAGIPDSEIVRAAIHPGIGVARVGDSKKGFFIGPEVTDPPLTEGGQSRDSSGAIKRQAARFRIYGYNSAGRAVRELTAADGVEIEWTAHLANKKSAWYRFLVAMDIPEAESLSVSRRNPTVTERAQLIVDPGPKSISGKNSAAVGLNGGKFMDVPVSLGEIRTDEAGRLLVLGGHGHAGSPKNTPVYTPSDADSFNNADGWWDDIADGPITAKVKLAGRELPVESSWVFVAPPNYAPDVIGWRTLYDLLVDTYVSAGMMSAPRRTSFTRDVLPILRRLTGLQWVNKGFANVFGRGKVDFDDPAAIEELAASRKKNTISKILSSFRLPGIASYADRKLWPMMYGDAYGSYDDSLRTVLGVPEKWAMHLRRWDAGEYINDYKGAQTKIYRQLGDMPIKAQPAMLDKAALHFCLADAFHPGCEVTWPMRHASMYRAPFRVKVADAAVAAPDYGDKLDSKDFKREDGPLGAQRPGDLTRWMAMPWHGDTVFCRSGYEPEFDPYLPTFWPARVPNHVLTEEDYRIVMDTSLPREKRLAAYHNRQHWTRNLKGDVGPQMMQMVASLSRMGVIEARAGVTGDPEMPDRIWVESLPPARADLETSSYTAPKARSAPRLSPTDPVAKAGWESREQLESFRRLRRPLGR